MTQVTDIETKHYQAMTVTLSGEDDYTWYRAAELEHNPFLWLFAKGEEKKKVFLLIKWAHLVSLRASNPAACKWHFYWVTFHSRTPLAVYYWGCKHLSQHSYLVNIATSQGRGLLTLSSMPQGKLLDHTLSSSSVPSEGDRSAHNSLGWRKPLYRPGPAAGCCLFPLRRMHWQWNTYMGPQDQVLNLQEGRNVIVWMFLEENNVSERHNSQRTLMYPKLLLISPEAVVNVEPYLARH